MRTFLFVAVAAVLLSGCGQLNTFVTANQAAVIRDAQTANDNMVHGIEAAACAVPVGAVIRNPDFVPVVQAACMPAGAQSNPAQMLQNMQSGQGTAVPAYMVPSVSVVTPASPVTVAPLTQTAPKQAINSRKVVTTHKNAAIMAPKATVMPAPVVVPVPPAVNPFASFPAQPLPGGALP